MTSRLHIVRPGATEWMPPRVLRVIIAQVRSRVLVLDAEGLSVTIDRASGKGRGQSEGWALCTRTCCSARWAEHMVDGPEREARAPAKAIDLDAALELHEQGLRWHSVAKRLGVGRQSLANALRRAGHLPPVQR